MWAPVTSASVTVPVTSTAAVISIAMKPGEAYELVATVDVWIQQGRADEKVIASPGTGSMFVPRTRAPVVLSGFQGAQVSVVRGAGGDSKASGSVTLTPLVER